MKKIPFFGLKTCRGLGLFNVSMYVYQGLVHLVTQSLSDYLLGVVSRKAITVSKGRC
jgi:hypothetical protein